MKKLIIIGIAILMMTSLACSISVNVPRIDTGEMETLEINEDYPDSFEVAEVIVEMGGGQLFIQGGGDTWVSGTVQYNVPLWSPEVVRRSSSVKITQETKDRVGLPDDKVTNEWDLTLGDHPTNLFITAGAYQGELDLTGISLTNLEIRDGASQADIFFYDYNPVVMEEFSYKTGASQINIEGLGYANAEEVTFEGGAGSYELDFGGPLKQDMDVYINYGLGDVKLIIPPGTRTRVSVEGGLNNVELSGTWNVDGSEYENNGEGPLLDIRVKMGVGNLQLINR